LTVKVPEGMMSEELARPVVVITSFLSKNTEYEIYTFGEQIVVMPIGENQRLMMQLLIQQEQQDKMLFLNMQNKVLFKN
jgi:predicted PilT family ATPase